MALKLKGSTSGFVGLDAPAVSGNNTLILPENSGSAFQLFANDITAGVTTFTSVSVNRNGDLTVPGTISIGGTLTYEDVTSVDSVGIVTARGLSIFGNTTGLNATGVSTFTGNVSMGGGNLIFGDSGSASDDRIQIGASQDLSLYHNGAHSYIDNTGGSLFIKSSNQVYIQDDQGRKQITCVDGAAVELYHAGVDSVRLQTTTTGVSVPTLNVTGISTFTGNVYMPDNAEIRFGASGDLQLFHNSSSGEGRIYNSNAAGLVLISNLIKLKNQANNQTMLQATNGGAVELYHNNTKRLETTANGVSIPQILQMGTSSSYIDLPDNASLYCGTGDDLRIYHDSSNSFVANSTGYLLISSAGDSILRSSANVELQPAAGESGVKAIANGAAELYHDNSKRFHTTSTGAYVTGDLTLTSNLVLGNSDEIKLGSSSQMTIWHSGSDFFLYNSAGNLVISNASGTGVGEGAIVFKSGTNSTRWSISSGGDFIPAANNAFTVGSSSNRVAVFYSNTSLNTSDRNEKNTITDSDLGLSFINKLRPVSYKWNQKEGEILDTKTHYGLIAQDIEETVLTEGKEITDFGFIDKPKEGQMSLAYSEFISPLVKAIQELSAENTALKARLDAAGL